MRVIALFVALVILPVSAVLADDAALWKSLRDGGHIALMRHALAPGGGDPDHFALDDCTTQRNLSEIGREQARRIGDRFRANGIAAAAIFTSQWCRCRETARLLDLGSVDELQALNSFFQRAGRRGPQTEALRHWIADQPLSGPVLLVTHQVNISALTGQYTTSGEMVVLRREDDGVLRVIGSIETE